jgi:hypothetical protein
MKQIRKQDKEKEKKIENRKKVAGILFGPAANQAHGPPRANPESVPPPPPFRHKQVGPTGQVTFYLRPGDLEEPDARDRPISPPRPNPNPLQTPRPPINTPGALPRPPFLLSRKIISSQRNSSLEIRQTYELPRPNPTPPVSLRPPPLLCPLCLGMVQLPELLVSPIP